MAARMFAAPAPNGAAQLDARSTRPHDGWIERVGDVIAKLDKSDSGAGTLLFVQADTDARYRAAFAQRRADQRHRALADQGELAEWKAAQDSLKAVQDKQASAALALEE